MFARTLADRTVVPMSDASSETVEWSDRFAENVPSYLSEDDTVERLQRRVEHGLMELHDEHGRLDNISIETNVHRSRREPQCSYLEVSIEAESVRWSR